MDKYEKLLQEHLGEKLSFYNKVDSTNDVAKKMEKWEHGTIIVAKEQTAGRGTYGRTFFSKAERGIYMTLIVDLEKWTFKHEHLATHYTAVVASEAIEKVTGVKIALKWVNDLFLDGKKIGGILTEKVFQSNKLIIGIGINLTGAETDFPEEIKTTAKSLGLKPPVDKMAAALVISLYQGILNSGMLDVQRLLTCYKEKLFILGEAVEIIQGEKTFVALVSDVSLCGGLIVETTSEKLTLQAGEVKLKL